MFICSFMPLGLLITIYVKLTGMLHSGYYIQYLLMAAIDLF